MISKKELQAIEEELSKRLGDVLESLVGRAIACARAQDEVVRDRNNAPLDKHLGITTRTSVGAPKMTPEEAASDLETAKRAVQAGVIDMAMEIISG